MSDTLGWDIGGVNTKAARVVEGEIVAVRGVPFELQRAPDALVPLLRRLAGEIGAGSGALHAVTMTAELSQMFRCKREGVAFVLHAVETAFPSASIHVFTVDARFLAPAAARDAWLAVAAANWSATARVVAAHHPDAVLVDVGTTTADVIPIVNGAVAAAGRTDPERLASGELVYTGVLRTPVEAMVSHVPFDGLEAGVSAEGFALAGDVHVWRGDLDPADYTVATPDGRPTARPWCGERLARVVCADREILDEAAITRIANRLADAQCDRLTSAIHRVVTAHPSLRLAVVTGLGAFLGAASARAAGLHVVPLAAELGDSASRCAPAASVALLLEQSLKSPASIVESGVGGAARAPGDMGETRPSVIDTVVKLGGGVLAHARGFGAALETIASAARSTRLLVVPGGARFADVVRDVDREYGLSDASAHWMAILAMDQYAHVIAEKLPGGVLVADRVGIAAALAGSRIPVLAPARWLREADPLPHSWDVTSDSLAAWIAGELGARQLVLIKPPGVTGAGSVDRHFVATVPGHVQASVVAVDRLEAWLSSTAAG